MTKHKLQNLISKNSSLDNKFRKSTASEGGNCVEVAKDTDGVRVRDTKDRTGPLLVFTHDEWRAFLTGVQNGEFDLE